MTITEHTPTGASDSSRGNRRFDLTLIIPAYNEENRLAPTLQSYGRTLAGRFGSFEILVVANGCRDNTVQVALSLASTVPQIRVIEMAAQARKGGAVLEGFRQAAGQIVLFADADGATPSKSLLDLADQLAHNDRLDIVIGSRLSSSQVIRAQPLKRWVLGSFFAAAVRVLFQLPYRDTQCGAKAFRCDAARRLSELVEETRWAFDVDLLLCAKALGLKVAEYPVAWADQAGSQLRVGSTSWEILRSFWRLKQRHTDGALESGVVSVP